VGDRIDTQLSETRMHSPFSLPNREPLAWQNVRAVQICSDQPDVSFYRPDYFVHLSAPHLFGKAKREAFGRVKGNMRR
jgi:hypothetical protein